MTDISRTELINRLWEKAEPTAFIPKDDFVRGLEDWVIYPILDNGSILMIVGVNGAHMHYESMHTGRMISRRVVKAILQPIIDKHGYAITKTPKEEIRQRRFNERIGFKVAGEDQYDIHYRIEHVCASTL